MTSHNELFSDIAEAGRLSRRLVGAAPRTANGEPEQHDEPSYLQFRPRGGLAETTLPALQQVPASSEEIGSWQELLAWAVGICGARAAFVVDAQGFIIADTGDQETAGFRGAGADLGFATEQLSRLDDESGHLQSIELQYERCHLVVIRAEGSDTHLITLVKPTAMSREFKSAVRKQARHLAGEAPQV